MGKLIMIVDDSASLRQVVAIALKGAGYDVIEASDGKDLIVSDVNMPNMDGITMVREIKKLPNYKFTPIMMLTTESDTSKKMAGKEAGAKAWLVKPFQPPTLLDAVSKLVLP
jgi:two-component system chemotaxis response regulator CheY